MSDAPETKAPEDGASASSANGAATPPPSLNVITQYIKDLSFENPNAPQSLVQPTQQQGPKIEIGVNVNAKPMADDTYEVDLALEGRAAVEPQAEGEERRIIFQTELTYSGVFKIDNVPKEAVHPFVLIECPRLLFPFARQVIADATRNGGFPPLLIDPIDFAQLYRQRMAQAQAQAATKDEATA